MTSSQLVPALVIPFLIWRVARRVQRNIGRQTLHRTRLIVSIVLWSVASAFLAVGGLINPMILVGLAGGLAAGAATAIVGLKLTRFETIDGKLHYTPNTYIGLSLVLLLVGRIVYRVIVVLGDPSLRTVGTPEMFQSPLTLIVYGLTAGYYIAYSAGVLSHANTKQV